MRTRRRSVLIADSKRDNAQRLRHSLEQAGFQVFIANDGEQACILAARQRFELIIANPVLSVVNSIEFCRHVREDLHLTDVPIALCTKAGKENADSIMELGIARVFPDSVDDETVVEFAREITGNLVAA